MEQLIYLFYRYGILLQAIAIIHFIRRRPENYWLWIIIIGGGLGALVYIFAEMIPDLGLLRGTFQGFPRRRRIQELQGLILDNPSAGNYEELADLYLQEKNYAQARECYDKAISARTDHADPFYRRALCAIEMGDFAAALPDLERVMTFDPKYDYHRARGLLAHAYARTGQAEKAHKLFPDVVQISTLSETQYNYAWFLAEQGQAAQAREWAQRVLNKKATLPRYLSRKERPWFRKASALLKQVQAAPAG
jgi:hypothetical protein